jgi:hypothetical protein
MGEDRVRQAGTWRGGPMAAGVFLATTGEGLVRATPGAGGAWDVAYLLSRRIVRCLAADPLAPHVVYAGTEHEGVLRSDDGGLTWAPTGLAGRNVRALAVSRAAPGTVYAGTKPALVFISRDAGATWAELAGFRRIASRRFWFSPAERPYRAYVQGLACSPTDPGVVLAGIEFGATVRSADGGATWTGHRRGALRGCHTLAFHATDGAWVYEGGGSGAGVACSADGGLTWRQPRAGLDHHYGWACAADPADPAIWYAALAASAFKAHGSGSAQAAIYRAHGAPGADGWEQLAGGLPDPIPAMPYALLTDPAAPGHLYAGLSTGDIWHTADHGTTWTQLPLNLTAIHRTLIMLPG